MMQEEQIRQAADALWSYMLKKHLKPYLADSVCYYRAVVTAAPANGVIEVQRPFDIPVSLPYMWSAQNLSVGDQCTVLVFGDPSNAIVMGDGALQDSGSSSGTVTRIATGDGLTGGPITTSGTISASYGANTPAMDGTGSAGAATTLSRSDHVHPSDTSKQDVLTFDNTPTSGSANPVTSGGVYTAISGKADNIQGVWYGVCATAAGTQEKEVTIAGIASLAAGLSIRVKFTSLQNYNGQPTLNLNSLGAFGIVVRGTTAAARYSWQAGEVVDLLYDGTNWVMVDGAIASATGYGVTKLNNTVTSTSTAEAATANAVKTAYDAADSALSIADDAYTLAEAAAPKASPAFTGTPTAPTAASGTNTTQIATTAFVQAAISSAGGSQYAYTFTASDWSGSSPYTLTLSAATHGCGTDPLTDVLILNGTSYEKYYGYPSAGWTMSIDASGNITLTSATNFAGKIIVR